jgi:hypothetical protein
MRELEKLKQLCEAASAPYPTGPDVLGRVDWRCAQDDLKRAARTALPALVRFAEAIASAEEADGRPNEYWAVGRDALMALDQLRADLGGSDD